MRKKRWRRWSFVATLIATVIAGTFTAGVVATLRVNAVDNYWAAASFGGDGSATVRESIDYHFLEAIEPVEVPLPDVPAGLASHVRATRDGPDPAVISPGERGLNVRFPVPETGRSVPHRFTVSYPAPALRPIDRRVVWRAMGAPWQVPVHHVGLDLVAPWRWRSPSCEVHGHGSVMPCRITQPRPGQLVISHEGLLAGESITVRAGRGAPLGAAPLPRVPERVTVPARVGFGVGVGVGCGIAFLLASLGIGHLLRRIGRDRVRIDRSGFALTADRDIESGADGVRTVLVDEGRLGDWATTEFAPPSGIAAWQGGVLNCEYREYRHCTAWLLGLVTDGYVTIDTSDAGAPILRVRPRPEDFTTRLLARGVAGRTEIPLGVRDPHFAKMWGSVGSQLDRWLAHSVFIDQGPQYLPMPLAVVGGLGVGIGVGIGAWSMATMLTNAAIGVVGLVVGAAVAGGCFSLVTRSWEVTRRTPAGSTMWLHVESFRRFLHGSEAGHVAEAARVGVLRAYGAWAVALGEMDSWSVVDRGDEVTRRRRVPRTANQVFTPQQAEALLLAFGRAHLADRSA